MQDRSNQKHRRHQATEKLFSIQKLVQKLCYGYGSTEHIASYWRSVGTGMGDVYNFRTGKYREHIVLNEQKTGKRNIIASNKEAIQALQILQDTLDTVTPLNIFLKAG